MDYENMFRCSYDSWYEFKRLVQEIKYDGYNEIHIFGNRSNLFELYEPYDGRRMPYGRPKPDYFYSPQNIKRLRELPRKEGGFECHLLPEPYDENTLLYKISTTFTIELLSDIGAERYSAWCSMFIVAVKYNDLNIKEYDVFLVDGY